MNHHRSKTMNDKFNHYPPQEVVWQKTKKDALQSIYNFLYELYRQKERDGSITPAQQTALNGYRKLHNTSTKG